MNEQAKKLIELVNKRNVEKNTKFIAVSSGKGGVGKTTFAVNFAYHLSNTFNKKVLLIDADMGMADIHTILNIKPTNNIKNLINGKKLEDIVVSKFNIDILPGFSGIESIDDLDGILISKIINDLAEFSAKYDYLIIDTSAGIDNKVSAFIRASNRSYIITTPEPTAYLDAYALIKSIYKVYYYSNFKLIINMCKNKNEALEVYDRLKASFNKFLNKDFEFYGWIPFSKTVNKAIKEQKLVAHSYPSDPFSQYIKNLAAKEVGEKVEDIKPNFWERLINLIKG